MRFRIRSLGSVVVLTVCAALLVGCGDDDGAPQEATPATSTTTQGSTAPSDAEAGDGEVSVSVEGLDDAVGSQLAGVLYRGPEAVDPEANAMGGFAVTVDADPFSTVQPVREPGPDTVGTFPYVSDAALLVEPGTYTLVLWLAPELGPYSRWVPAGAPGLEGCEITFVAGAAPDVEIDGHRIQPLHAGTMGSCEASSSTSRTLDSVLPDGPDG